MKYYTRCHINIQLFNDTIEADSKEKATEIARIAALKALKGKVIKDLLVTNAFVSNSNFMYEIDSVYLIKRYNKEVLAKCISSSTVYGRTEIKFRHIFELVATKKHVSFFVLGKQLHPKVIRKICDGKISKTCKGCEARFICYTKRD